MGDLDKPLAAATTAPTFAGVVIPTGVTKNATPHKGRLATVVSRPRRLSVLRLAVTVAALCVVLWVFSSDLLWQMTQRSGSSSASLLATPNLRANSTTSTTTTEPKQCVKLSMGHVEKAFFRADNCLSRSDIQQIILGLVWTLADVFEKNGIPYWLDSGTLLGSVREKTVIPYDVDADIGISEASYFQLRDNKFEYPSETYELLVLGGKYHRSGPRDANIPARFIHKGSALYVDIFVFLDNKSDPAKFGPIPSVCFAGCYRCPKLGNWVQEFLTSRDWVKSTHNFAAPTACRRPSHSRSPRCVTWNFSARSNEVVGRELDNEPVARRIRDMDFQFGVQRGPERNELRFKHRYTKHKLDANKREVKASHDSPGCHF